MIAVHGQPAWVSALLYLTVLVTVLSGLDYFFGVRRRMQQSERAQARLTLSRALSRALAGVEPLLERRLVRRRGARARSRSRSSASSAVALGDDVVLVDRLEVLLARGDEARAVELGEARAPRRRSSRARSPRRSAGGGAPFRRPRPRRSASSARRSPRTCSPRRSPAARSRRSPRRTPPMQPICSVARPRWLCVATGTLLEDPLDLLRGEVLRLQALARARRDELLRARARRHAGRRDADDAPRAVLEGDRAAVQRVDLLRLHARDRRRLVLGVARRDRDLGALRRPGARARARRCAARASRRGTATR